MTVEKIETIADEGVALFIDQFKEKPRLEAWTRSFLDRCQDIENVLWDVIELRQLDNDVDLTRRAFGAQLDTLGRLVGQPRISADDEIFRLFIRVRVRVNRSKGQSTDIIAVVRLATSDQDCQVRDMYPASIVVETIGPIGIDPASLAQIIADTRGAAIGSSLHFTSSPDDETFAFAEFDIAQTDTARGLSNDTGTTGGKLIGAL